MYIERSLLCQYTRLYRQIVASAWDWILNLHNWQRLEIPAQHGLNGDLQGAGEDGGVDGAEIHGEADVAFVEVLGGEAGVGAVQAAFDVGAEHEHGGGRAVVGAAAAV